MKKSFRVRNLVLVGLVVALVPMLQAEVWSGTKSFSADTVYDPEDEAIELSGEVKISVTSGKTLTLSNVVEGTGSISTIGKGRVVLAGANTFSGGIKISKGYVRAASDDALGTGKVTILGQRDGYSGICMLEAFGGVVGMKVWTTTLTLTNDIEITGNSTPDYPALTVYNQNVVFTGKITAAADFVFHDDGISQYAISKSYYSTYEKVLAATFGEVTATGGIISDGWSKFVFTGKVSAAYFAAQRNSTLTGGGSNWNAAYEFQDTLTVNAFTNTRHNIEFKTAQNNPKCVMTYDYNELAYAKVAVAAGANQTWGAFSSVELSNLDTQWRFNDTKTEMKTLTLTGVDTSDPVQSYVATVPLGNKLSLVVDAYDGFTQTFRGRVNSMSGTIRVKNGALVIDGASSFASVTALTVDEGASLTLASTTNNAFTAVTSITVDGSLSLNEHSFTNGIKWSNVNLALKSTGSFTVDGGGILSVKSLSIDGQVVPGGVYTHANLQCLGDGICISMVPPASATVSAVWTGADAANSTLMTDAGNWFDPVTPNLAHGVTAVAIDEAATNVDARMTYADGTYLAHVSNTIPFTAAADAVCRPFRVEPSTPGGKLYLCDGIQSYKTNVDSGTDPCLGQLVLSGHIAPPPSFNAGAVSKGNKYAIRIRNSQYTDSTRPAGLIESTALSVAARSVPLVFDNATVDLPMYLYHKVTLGNSLYAYPGSTNVINGEIYVSGYQANAAAGSNAVIELRGGIGSAACFRFLGPGEIRVVDKPFNIKGGSYTEGDGKLVLDAEGCYVDGNEAREGFYHSYGELEFRRSGCFNSDDLQFTISSGRKLRVEFNATTQRVGIARFHNTSKGSEIHGDYPAMLEMTGQARTGAYANMIAAPTNNIQVTGGLGFHVCGEGAWLPLGSKAFASCGDLEASAGTLELLANASWLNGTNFTARGTGTLKFANGNQVNRNFAQLHLGADGGSVYVPAGERVMFAAADIEGVNVPHGTYTAASGGGISSRILGGGTVRIGATGTAILLR